ncbi:uncharacterized protein LOC111050892 isoform X1 [Nilaparvata lugens]|uniref:uncharacterized protein LOC111050892 isoform X1 n=1 Tax=Nilaparvata lugens TaxID=108931 RepID=UPI000B98E148|nr:uncharacterized protein LOC111050892 isoform X1 [Nilaparvata lugens]XP_039299053.1 uncharacterized protein LOC111050892 isoform X1 [Nilaparvata lugens]
MNFTSRRSGFYLNLKVYLLWRENMQGDGEEHSSETRDRQCWNALQLVGRKGKTLLSNSPLVEVIYEWKLNVQTDIINEIKINIPVRKILRELETTQKSSESEISKAIVSKIFLM